MIQNHLSAENNYQFVHRSSTVSEVISTLKSLLFPQNFHEASSMSLSHQLDCLSLFQNTTLVGMAVLAEREDEGAQIMSFFIRHEFRSQGLGYQLMQAVIDFSKQRGYQKIQIAYSTFWPNRESWEKILKKTAWQSNPGNLRYVLLEELQVLKRKHWVVNMQWPSNARITPLNISMVNYLHNWVTLSSWSQEVPYDVRLNKGIKQINQACSLLLSINHEIAGWIIVQALEDQVGQVSALFVRRKFGKRHRNLGLKLLAEAIKRNEIVAKVYFGYRKGHKYLERLTRNKFGDISIQYEKRICFKILK